MFCGSVILGACFHCPSPRWLTLLVPVNLAGPESFIKTVGLVSKRIGQNRDFKLVRKTGCGPELSPRWLGHPHLFPELGNAILCEEWRRS